MSRFIMYMLTPPKDKDCPKAKGPIPFTSTYSIVATPDQVVNGTTFTGGQPVSRFLPSRCTHTHDDTREPSDTTTLASTATII